jgi:hypothetical protein
MKRLLAGLILGVLLAGSAVGASFNQSKIVKAMDSVVHVLIYPWPEVEAEEDGYCAGVVVAPNKVLTAAHCAYQKADTYIDDAYATLVARDSNFALFETWTSKPPVTFGAMPKLLDEVFGVGWAWNNGLYPFHGYVTQFKDGDFAIDHPLAPGQSGGPMFNAKGEMIGLNQMTNPIIGIACGVNEIRAFLAAVR